MKGLRFERIANGRHYNVVFHIGSTYVPVSDDTVEELKEQSLLPAERFLDLLIDRVGYSSYLKDQIRNELKATGDPPRRSPSSRVRSENFDSLSPDFAHTSST